MHSIIIFNCNSYFIRLHLLKRNNSSFEIKKRKIQFPIILFLDYFYLPFFIAIGRLLIVKRSVLRPYLFLEADPRVKCQSIFYIIACVVSLPICLIYIIGFPILYAYLVHLHLVYNNEKDHEIYIMWKEEQYCRNLGNNWSLFWLPLYSSYRRKAVYYRPLMQIFKVILGILYFTARGSTSVQSLMFFFLYLAWAMYINYI